MPMSLDFALLFLSSSSSSFFFVSFLLVLLWLQFHSCGCHRLVYLWLLDLLALVSAGSPCLSGTLCKLCPEILWVVRELRSGILFVARLSSCFFSSNLFSFSLHWCSALVVTPGNRSASSSTFSNNFFILWNLSSGPVLMLLFGSLLPLVPTRGSRRRLGGGGSSLVLLWCCYCLRCSPAIRWIEDEVDVLLV